MQASCQRGGRNPKWFLGNRADGWAWAGENALTLDGAAGALDVGVLMTRRLRLGLATACSLLAVVLCLAYGRQTRAEAERERAEALERYGGEVTRVVVASQGLEAGEVVTRQNVAERDWVSDLVPAGTIVELDEVLGRQVSVPAAQGAPLTAVNFREEGTAAEVPDGYAAVSIPAGEKLGLPAGIKAGTRIAAFRVRDAGARLVTSDLQVISAAADISVGGRATVTLAARPSDVPELLVAGGEGSLRLVVPADGVEVVAGDQTAPSEVRAVVAAEDEGAELEAGQ